MRLAGARRVVVVADSSKLGQVSLATFASCDDVDELFELLDAQLGDIGVDVKFEKKGAAAAEAEEGEEDVDEDFDDEDEDLDDEDEDDEDEDDEESEEEDDDD